MSPFAGDARAHWPERQAAQVYAAVPGGTSQTAAGGTAAAPLHELPRPTRPEPSRDQWLTRGPHLSQGHLPAAAAGTTGIGGGGGRPCQNRGSCTRGGARAPLLLLSSLASGNDAAALQKAHKSESRRGPPPHPLARARSTLPLCWLPLSPPTSGFPALSCRCLCLCPHLLSLLSLEKVFLTRVLTPF